MIKKLFRSTIIFADRFLGLRELMREDKTNALHPLEGDRCIEWQWVLDNLPQPPAKVLDVGCTHSVIAGFAAVRGLDVTGIDLLDLGYGIPNLTFVRGDITKSNIASTSFDYVVLCSTLEHIGLKGRYSSSEYPDGDLAMMQCTLHCLKPSGHVLLTIPVGKDEVIPPAHRIYGHERLPIILKNFKVFKEEYWVKNGPNWVKAEKDVALSTKGRADFYALGLFILQKAG